jgi:transposase-like protein
MFLARTPWPAPSRATQLIAIADAMIQEIERRPYTFYFILLRPARQHQATIMQPFIQEGTETWEGWQEAFAALPKDVESRIVALVCDGHTGLVGAALAHHWLIQRCHFHLLARIQSRRSKWKISRHKALGRFLYRAVRIILTHPNEQTVRRRVRQVRLIGKETSSRDLRTTLLGFTNHYQDWRTYLSYPELHLPRTNNAAESMIGGIRGLLHRARGFRTQTSLTHWVHALLKYRKTFTCNGFFPPN